MILGIGVDSIEVNRFRKWQYFSHKQLLRIFSQEEIEYCLSHIDKSAERFAVRFAAREAFFKAFTAAFPDHTFFFLTVCRVLHIAKKNNCPYLVVNWKELSIAPSSHIRVHISLTHSDLMATAFVIIEQYQ